MAARRFSQIAPGGRVALNGVEWTIEDIHGRFCRLGLSLARRRYAKYSRILRAAGGVQWPPSTALT
jgi:hypothetical protein